MDTSDDVITSEDTSLEDIQIEHAWRDDNWLVLHEKKAVLPRRCVVCDQPAFWTLDMFLRETHTASDWLSHSVFFFFLAFARFLDNTLSQSACVRLPLCDEHYQLTQKGSRTLYRLYIMGFLLALAGSLWMIIYVIIHGLQFEPPEWPAYLIITGILLVLFAWIANAIKPKLIQAKKIQKPFVWLEGVSPDYLARFPEVPRQ